jgi:hypothetical protein
VTPFTPGIGRNYSLPRTQIKIHFTNTPMYC